MYFINANIAYAQFRHGYEAVFVHNHQLGILFDNFGIYFFRMVLLDNTDSYTGAVSRMYFANLCCSSATRSLKLESALTPTQMAIALYCRKSYLYKAFSTSSGQAPCMAVTST